MHCNTFVHFLSRESVYPIIFPFSRQLSSGALARVVPAFGPMVYLCQLPTETTVQRSCDSPFLLSKARLSSPLLLAMDGLASHYQQDQSPLHVDQHRAATISDIHPAASSSGSSTDSDSSLSEPSSHLGQNSLLNSDPGVSSVVLALPDQQTPQTSTETMIGLTPLVEERSTGGVNPDQHVISIGLVDNIPVKDQGEALLGHVNGQIELLEGSPDVSIGSGDSGLIVEENQEWIPDPDHELKRVKVSWPHSMFLKFSACWFDYRPPTMPCPCSVRFNALFWVLTPTYIGLRTYRPAMGGPGDCVLLRTVFRRKERSSLDSPVRTKLQPDHSFYNHPH